jgi:hypothetical protein
MPVQTERQRRRLFVVLSIVSLIASPACNTKQNAGDVSQDLADKLTDSMDFPGEQVVKGGKPSEHAGSSDYPQITRSDFAASDLQADQKFSVDLYTSYDKADLEGVIVYIPPASKYIQVPAKFSRFDTTTMWTRLTGYFHPTPDLYNKPFKMQFALYKTGDKAGNYVEWQNVKLVPQQGGQDGGIKVLLPVGGGQVFKSANYGIELFVSPGQPTGGGGAGGKYKVRLGPGGVRVDPSMGGK